MGAGKTSVGQSLHRRTGLPLIETDEIVTARFGISIPEIFAQHGEEKFRVAEAEVLAAISPKQSAIIATGGGIATREKNVEILKRLGTIVWLDADERILFQRASATGDRPLLKTNDSKATFLKLLAARRPLYGKIADLRIDTSRLTVEEIAETILKTLPFD